jgi:hypothetical protein
VIALHLVRALGVRGSLVLACLLVVAVTAYGVADDLGLLDPPAAAKPARPSACWRSTAGSAGSTPTRPALRAVDPPPRGSWSTLCTRRQNLHNLQNLTRRPVLSVL